MRKRASTPRHYRLRLDTLEERSLLSAFTVQSAGYSPPSVIVEKGPPDGAVMSAWKAPGWHGGVAHVISVAGGPGTGWMSGGPQSDAPGAGPSPYGEGAGGAQPAVVSVSGPGGRLGGYTITVSGQRSPVADPFRNSASAAPGESTDLTSLPELALAKLIEASAAPDGGLTVAAQTEVIGAGSYTTGPGLARPMPPGAVIDLSFTSVQYRMGPVPGPAIRANMDSTIEDHPDPNAGHDLTIDPTTDAEVQAFQPILGVQNAFGASAVNPAVAGHDAAVVSSLPAAGPALALRVGATTPGQDSGGTLGLEHSGTRIVVPSPGVSSAIGEGVVVVSGPAASTAQAAAAAINAAPADAPTDQVAGEVALVADQSPSPQGLGLIDHVLPFDRDTVAAAIDRFFDRFDQSGAELDDDREPAALTPPPSALVFALAATEAARRHFKRKREEDAAARPRRRDVEGLGFEDSFGSSGPWSSRLS